MITSGQRFPVCGILRPPMRIALLTDSDVFAGTERHMLDLAVELKALGVSPTLLCPDAGMLAARARPLSLPVRALEKKGSLDFGAISQLRQWFGRDFDLIHAHNGRTALHAAIAKIGQPGTLVATQHFLSPARATRSGVMGWIGNALHHWAGGNISRVIAISQAVADALLARKESPREKVRVVLNGIRDPQEQPLVSRAETRIRYQLPADAPVIVCLARLDREKGVEHLLEAMVAVGQASPGVRCLIAGRGDLETELRNRLAAMQPAPPVEFLGFVEDSLSLVNAADIFVLPSLAEPFGLSIVEAMALGKPVVTTRAGGPLEIVVEGKTGFLVAPGNTAELSAALIKLVANVDDAAKMGKMARLDFLARFTAARMAREMLSVYEEAVTATSK